MPTRGQRKFRHKQNDLFGIYSDGVSRTLSDHRRRSLLSFLSDVAIEKIPSTRSGQVLTEEDTSAVMNALNAIIPLRQLLRPAPSLGQPCCIDPDAAWPKFFAWMQYLYQSGVVHEQCDKTTQQIAITEIAGLAHFYVFNHSKTVMATPTFTVFATELWLKEQLFLAKYPKIKSGYKGMVFSEIIAQQLSGGEFVRDMIVAVMIKGAGGSADTLAAYNIKYLRSALAVDSPNFDLVRVLIFILMVSCDGDGGILAAFERRSGITFATKAFLAAANRITNSMDFDVLQTLRVSYLFFDNMSLLQTNPGWIAKALEAGLLNAFLLSCSVVETKLDNSLAMVAVKVLNIIKKALVLHSVLRTLKQPFQEIIESDIAKPRAAGLLWKEWVSFTDLAKERLMIMDVADMCGVTKSNSSKTCGFSACPNVNRVNDVKPSRCTGCRSTHYCSRECQRKAWPEHRAFCQSIRGNPGDNVISLSKPTNEVYSESKFFMFLIDQTFNIHKDAVLDRIFDYCDQNKEKITNIDQLTSFVVCIDFQAIPLAIMAGKMLHFNSSFLTLPDDQDGRPVDIPVFRLVPRDGQDDIRQVADEDDPKITVQTRTVSIGQWMFDVRSFYVRLNAEFRKRFNEKRVERYRIVEME